MSHQDQYQYLLSDAARRALKYLEHVGGRRVFPSREALDDLARLGGPMPQQPEDPLAVLKLLDEAGSPATVATAAGRYFGFVVGGALPVTVAAHWLAGAWDQN